LIRVIVGSGSEEAPRPARGRSRACDRIVKTIPNGYQIHSPPAFHKSAGTCDSSSIETAH
jgi:uncharacterized protein (DUF779 family)